MFSIAIGMPMFGWRKNLLEIRTPQLLYNTTLTMNVKIIKRNTPIVDQTSKIKGIVTHVTFLQGGVRLYTFQPKGLNPETGLPAGTEALTEGNFGDDWEEEEVEVPLDVLGTPAKDSVTGFKGNVSAIILHPNGCVHASLQPEGVNKKTGKSWDSCDFYIWRLTGPAFPKLSEKQIEQKEKKNPSPAPFKLTFR